MWQHVIVGIIIVLAVGYGGYTFYRCLRGKGCCKCSSCDNCHTPESITEAGKTST
ncbi:MAG: FeoB-associated Cys-rich membrane protein [Planctomycetota bacterium]|nr:FeoB-associated Cys-rich membrane protein [Planctomycetota bacterium]